MKSRLFYVLVTSAFLTASCVGKPFQPIPPKFKQWGKEGVTPDGVKAALLECGYDNPYTGFQTHKNVAYSDLVRADVCMERKGFRYLLDDRKSICDSKVASNVPACR